MVRTVLVLNAGSSSLKYALIHPDGSRERGTVERIGEGSSAVPDHATAIGTILSDLPADVVADIDAVGHRVVHGGTRFHVPVLIDSQVEHAIGELAPLAPLHNPANLLGIRAARRLLPATPQVAVFDTAFHATLPPAASTYALDTTVAREVNVRRFGFHGISLRYVVGRVAELLGRADLDLIVLHLGNGASATAVRSGESVDTSMGMTPLEGLVMGTRTGDIDPAAAFQLIRAGYSPAEVEELFEHRGGLYGLCGDNDMRAVLVRANANDPRARLAVDVYCHRLRRYVGGLFAVLGRADAIVFTAGVGEHASPIRAQTLVGLDGLGIRLDPTRNASLSTAPRVISTDDSPVAVLVVPTDEEQAIADEVRGIVHSG
jgi:acetate kinase